MTYSSKDSLGNQRNVVGEEIPPPFHPCCRIFPNFYIQLQIKKNLINHTLKKRRIIFFAFAKHEVRDRQPEARVKQSTHVI